jgi:pyruvate kinase
MRPVALHRSAPAAAPSRDTPALALALTTLRAALDEALNDSPEALAAIHPEYHDSARNLLQYLALRRQDLRELQGQLAALGLSSLGRAESHVAAAVDLVRLALQRLEGHTPTTPVLPPPVADGQTGHELLSRHTTVLLGPAQDGRATRIMVTMPSEAARDYVLVRSLLEAGMDVMRINCAHDGPNAWARMIRHLRRAESATGRTCRVAMDLGGPKLRTGPLQPGPAVCRIRPTRDPFGRVVAPARIWFTSAEHPVDPPSSADAVLPVSPRWLASLAAGDRVTCRDARDSDREWQVIEPLGDGVWVEASNTGYVVPGTKLRRRPAAGASGPAGTATVGALSPAEAPLLLAVGDTLIVTRDLTPGKPATHDSAGRVLTPATIGCTLPEVFDDVQPGEAIWFDDGRIGGVIDTVDETHAVVRITVARAGGAKLRADKGINLPESTLRLPALTPQDIADLPFVAAHADIVELSFANVPTDVAQLQAELLRLGARQPAIVLKIETQRGFASLPALLLQAMQGPCCGVMIARGDLAVECGFERLAEVQEEILWICEAAHVPVIWATQVLESLATSGLPSRAEITDAAMGHRAECVMLNKGPHIIAALGALDDILRRMHAHQDKKRSMLRELRLAHTLAPSSAPAT